MKKRLSWLIVLSICALFSSLMLFGVLGTYYINHNFNSYQNVTGTITLNSSNGTTVGTVHYANFTWINISNHFVVNVTAFNDTQDDFNLTVNFNTANVSDGVYNVTVRVYNSSGTVSTVNASITNITVDNTAPNVTRLISPTGVNISTGTLDLSANVTDGRKFRAVSVDKVRFNVSNTTASTLYTAELYNLTGSTLGLHNVTYNYTLDVSTLADGTYTVTVLANDTQTNNLNNSGTVNVTFVKDNSLPTVEVDCSPASVISGGPDVTCTCTGADAHSSVYRRVFTSTASPENIVINPGVAGTFTETCTVTNNAGLNKSASDSYTVTDIGGGGGGGGGGGSGGGASSDEEGETTNLGDEASSTGEDRSGRSSGGGTEKGGASASVSAEGRAALEKVSSIFSRVASYAWVLWILGLLVLAGIAYAVWYLFFRR